MTPCTSCAHGVNDNSTNYHLSEGLPELDLLQVNLDLVEGGCLGGGLFGTVDGLGI